MKRILLIATIVAVVMTGCLTTHLYTEYTTKNGNKFMCKSNSEDKTADLLCTFNIRKGDVVYGCAVAFDKLKAGYKPDVDLDCKVIIDTSEMKD